MTMPFKLSVLMCALFLTACAEDDPDKDAKTFVYDLDEGALGWQAGFADYPEAAEAAHQLQSDWIALPAPLASRNGIFISGNNQSDDLFMYLKRRLTGLQPNTRYAMTFGVEFATNADSGCAGVGGPPGEGVVVKVGATEDEPLADQQSQGEIRMNIDHGNQGSGGSDAIIIGNIAGTHTDCTDSVYELKILNSENFSFEVFTGDEGELWALFATDSAFESTTGIYYTRIEILAEEI